MLAPPCASLSDDLTFWFFFVKEKDQQEQKRQVWSYRRGDGSSEVLF